ncbi:hypothetical protein BDW75DRAFT_206036 [Aspergillus navahoensis]
MECSSAFFQHHYHQHLRTQHPHTRLGSSNPYLNIYILYLQRRNLQTAYKSAKHLEHLNFRILKTSITSKIFPRTRLEPTRPKQSTMPSTTKSSTKTCDDVSSIYSAASTSTIMKEKEEAKRKWLFKSKSKTSSADSKNKEAALHYEAMAHYLAFR